MRRGRRKVENPETARRILAAAELHFAAHGMAGARTDEIAAAAHANKAMLYYYYENKQRLHRAVLENLFDQLRQAVYSPPPSKTTSRERLIRWVNGYFNFLASHPNYPRLIQRESMNATPQFQWIVREYFQPFHRYLTRLIGEGIADGEFRKVDAHQTVFTLLGMTAFYFAAAPAIGKLVKRNLLSPQALEERRGALLDFLVHGLMRAEARSR
jgi:TetR/AcrR family transcriptional regulator